MWPHQEESVAFFESVKVGFDNSDPGTGKTRVQLVRYSRRKKPRGRCLILCTKTLMESAWGTDIEKYTPELTYSLATAANREAAFKLRTDVVIMNIDGIKWLMQRENKKYLLVFDHLIIDEYTFFKHSTSQRSKALASARKQFQYRYALSGTPNPKTVMDLWHPTLIIDDGARLGNSYFSLRNKVQTPTQIGPSSQHLRWDDKPGMAAAFDELLGDITIRHPFQKVMTHVPPNHRHVKEFSLSPKAKKIYDQMERDCIVGFESGDVFAIHAASLRTKLLQIASGAVYGGDEEGAYQIIDTARYELVGDLVDERDHSVVFFNWKHQRDMLCREFEKRGFSYALIDGSVPDHERANIVRDFQAGVYKTILLHPKTGAHGLTLTAADTTILVSPIYEADLLKQAIMRIYRGTQDKVTNTILVQAKGTVEDIVYSKLYASTEQMEDLLSMMAARKHRIRKPAC